MNTLKQAIEKTVNFWSTKSFKTPMNQDNGGGNPMVDMLANQLSMSAQETITDEKQLKFEIKLTELLTAEPNPNRMSLDVDYGPCAKLREAAEFAGIDVQCFPCKTFTLITPEFEAKASYQYRGELKTL